MVVTHDRKERQPITVPKKNANISISFLPTSCRYAKVSYFYISKKEYNILATNKYCVSVENISVLKPHFF